MGAEGISEKSLLGKEMTNDELNDLIVEYFNITEKGEPPFRSQGKTRNDLAMFMGTLNFKTGAEIGVCRGAYSKILCHFNQGLKIKCVDPWTPFRTNSQERQERRYIRTLHRLKPYDAEIIRKTSMEAVRNVEDKSLDFVYIDAMHEFDFVMMDIIAWSDKVKQGGIVAGHDYTEPKWFNGVIDAVQAYTRVHDIKRWFITDEQEPSWFWVKP